MSKRGLLAISFASELGITVHRVPTLGAHPAFIGALASAVERTLGA